MAITQITDSIGNPDNAYAIVAMLSQKTKQEVFQLLAQLSNDLGGSIWIMPPEALHITLCEIIQPKFYSENKQTLYDRHASTYKNVTAEILANYESIDINFDTIEVSSQAIIIKGTDDGSFEKIRKEIVDKLPLPSESKLPPNIIHMSIARYIKAIPLDRVEKIVGQHSIKIHETVDKFQLINNTLTPLLEYKVIRTYPLSVQFQ